ncbi:transcription elongation factor GreA [Candidatus Shapirobacteria bacterium]|nr:transcription elongation factor GreA [Candidatus Shapirobacteria bacterium]
MVKTQEDIFLTIQGHAKLLAEHRSLKDEKRPKAVERLASARMMGDLAENSDYIQAKEELSFIDGRISELEEMIKRVKLIDNLHKSCQEVRLGCRVTVQAGKEQKIFHLVGEWEADPSSAKISHRSPLGQSLLGKKIGDKIEIEVPVGKIAYTILTIE